MPKLEKLLNPSFGAPAATSVKDGVLAEAEEWICANDYEENIPKKERPLWLANLAALIRKHRAEGEREGIFKCIAAVPGSSSHSVNSQFMRQTLNSLLERKGGQINAS